MKVAPIFEHIDWQPGKKPPDSWQDLFLIARDRFRGQLGISRSAWEHACTLLGRKKVVLAMAVIATKYAKGEISTPGGYLRGMVAQEARGKLNLEKSITALGKETNKHVNMQT